MPRGNRKHLTKKERQALLGETRIVDGEPFTTMKGLRVLMNALIDEGKTTLEHGMEVLEPANAKLDKPRTLMPCWLCGKKLGIKLCSGCTRVDAARYCSRECQIMAWHEHRTICASRQIRDVE